MYKRSAALRMFAPVVFVLGLGPPLTVPPSSFAVARTSRTFSLPAMVKASRYAENPIVRFRSSALPFGKIGPHLPRSLASQ